MSFVSALLLRLLHSIYYVVLLWHSFYSGIRQSTPQPLTFHRHRTPRHLAILLVVHEKANAEQVDSCLVQSVVNAIEWCTAVGIEKLTIYDEYGKTLKCSRHIRERLIGESVESSGDSDLEFPLTPPPSDESRSISPQPAFQANMETVIIHVTRPSTRKFRKDSIHRRAVNKQNSHKRLTVYLSSRQSSKPAIASAAQAFVSQNSQKLRGPGAFILTTEELQHLLDSDSALPSPDLMIVHPLSSSHYNQTPLELHGYPPWHIRLTEIYHYRHQGLSCISRHPIFHEPTVPISTPLDPLTFRHALDEFSTAEMRFGT